MSQKKPRRLPELHRVICESTLTKSQKLVLRHIVSLGLDVFSFGVHTVADRLHLDAKTVRTALRKIDDTTPAGAAVLRLVSEAKFGTVPRVYRIDLSRVNSAVLGRREGGKFPGVKPLAGNSRPKFPRITDLPSSCVSGAAEQPPSQGAALPTASVHSLAAARAKREAAKTASLGRGVLGGAL